MSLPEIGLFASSRKKSMPQMVRAREQFRAVLARERAAADRHEHEFSLLVFDSSTLGLMDVLARRVRQIDEIGWFQPGRIAVVLPYTAAEGARTLAQDIIQSMAPPRPNWTVYTYPSHWFAEENNGVRSPFSVPSCKPGRTSKAAAAAQVEKESRRRAAQPDPLLAGRMPVWKRTIDVLGSLIGLIFLFPIFLLVACAIRLASPGPAFLRQKRIGYRGKTFMLWKFRTMRVGANSSVHQDHLNNLIAQDRPMTKLDDSQDPRIFPLGRIVRRCYLDELPQLINVLRGDMSLIGPRPCIPYEAEQYQAWQTERFAAVPGMTGLWQVSGKNKTTFKEMIRLDIAYARNCSLWFDLYILLMTVPVIIEESIGGKRKSGRASKPQVVPETLAQARRLQTGLRDKEAR